MGDHRLADGLETLRRELAGVMRAVQPAHEPKSEFDRVDFARRLPVLDVVAFDEPPVPSDQLGDREWAVVRNRGRRFTATSEVLMNELVVLLPAFRRVVYAEIMIVARDRDDRVVAGFVQTVGRGFLAGHGGGPRSRIQYSTGFAGFQAAPPTIGGLA